MKTNGLHLSEAYANMTPDELTRLSPEEFTAFVIVHFEHQGYTLEECQLAPGGQLLLFRLERALCVVYCLPNPYLGGQIWDVTSVEVAWCVSAAENLTAARGYIITRSRFSFGAEKQARYAGRDIVLVNGESLKRWIR